MNKNEPMSGDLGPNRGTGTPRANAPRQCWAIKTLVAEVEGLFPETPVTYTNVDGRNTALAVTFDLTGVAESDRETFIDLMRLPSDDERIEYTMIEDEHVLISMRSNPRTQDSRESFNLADALHVLSGEVEEVDEEDDWPVVDLSQMERRESDLTVLWSGESS